MTIRKTKIPTADIGESEYLKHWQKGLAEKREVFVVKLSKLQEAIYQAKFDVTQNLEKINEICETRFEDSPEYIDEKITKNSLIKDIVICATFKIVRAEDKLLLDIALRYLNALEEYKECADEINKYNKLLSINVRKFREFIFKYYGYGMHKCLIEGYGYRFKNSGRDRSGLGILYIAIYPNAKREENRRLDYNQTYLKKKETLAAGLKLKDLKNPNDSEGVDWRVYNRTETHTQLTFCSGEFTNKYIVVRTIRNNISKGQGSTENAAAKCKTIDNVCKLKNGFRAKLAIALCVNPGLSIKYKRKVKFNNNKTEILKIRYKDE